MHWERWPFFFFFILSFIYTFDGYNNFYLEIDKSVINYEFFNKYYINCMNEILFVDWIFIIYIVIQLYYSYVMNFFSLSICVSVHVCALV